MLFNVQTIHQKYDNTLNEIHFFGFDSFDGFGDLSEDEKHVFFTKKFHFRLQQGFRACKKNFALLKV